MVQGSCKDEPQTEPSPPPGMCRLPAIGSWGPEEFDSKVLLPDFSNDAVANTFSPAPSFYQAHWFLYQRMNGDVGTPVQRSLQDGLITRDNISVVVGNVYDSVALDAALPCVQISVLGRPDLGRTVSTASGRFALAVPGDREYVIELKKPGYLPAQRTVYSPLFSYGVLPKLALLRLPEESKDIDFRKLASADAPEEVLGAEHPYKDNQGREQKRRARLWLLPGTTAELVMPDGTRKPMDQLSFQAVEFTATPFGRKAMPADLPPESHYTYAVEYTASQVAEHGALGIRFAGPPVVSYVEDFVGMTVGANVPVGTYNRARGVWEGEPNGRVIKILGVKDGEAQVATEPGRSGLPTERGTLLAAPLRFTPAELRRLSSLPVGTQLWRVLLEHLTPVDKNYPAVPPEGAEEPPRQDPFLGTQADGVCKNAATNQKETETRHSYASGLESSSVECQRRSLGLNIPVLLAADGTDRIFLNYSSRQVPGNRTRMAVGIQVTENVPTSLKKISVALCVNGTQYEWAVPELPTDGKRFPPRHFFYPYRLDKAVLGSSMLRNVFGTMWSGVHPAWLTVKYHYDGVYMETFDATEQAWAKFEGSRNMNARAQDEVILSRTSNSINLFGAEGSLRPVYGFGLDIHHEYLREQSLLLRGDGEEVSATAVLPFASKPYAGNGSAGPALNDQAATSTPLNSPGSLAHVRNGSELYIADVQNFRIQEIRRTREGDKLWWRAGAGKDYLGNAGQHALNVGIGRPNAIAVDSGDNLFIASRTTDMAQSGVIRYAYRTGSQYAYDFAGSQTAVGNDKPYVGRPLEIPLWSIGGMAVASALAPGLGTDAQALYVSETAAHQIRVILFQPPAMGSPMEKENPTYWKAWSWVLKLPSGSALSKPRGLAVIGSKNPMTGEHQHVLYVASSGSQTVLRLLVKYPAAGGEPTVTSVTRLVNNQARFDLKLPSKDETDALSTILSEPSGLAYWAAPDNSRRFLYVTDRAQHTVVRIDVTHENATARLIAGDPTRPPGSGCSPSPTLTMATDIRLNAPEGIAVSPGRGDLFVADSGNHRVCQLSTVISLGSDAAEAMNYDIVRGSAQNGSPEYYVFAAPGNLLKDLSARPIPAGRHLETRRNLDSVAAPLVRFEYDGTKGGLVRITRTSETGTAQVINVGLSASAAPPDGCMRNPCIGTVLGPKTYLDVTMVDNQYGQAVKQIPMIDNVSTVLNGEALGWKMSYLPGRGGLLTSTDAQSKSAPRTYSYTYDDLLGEVKSFQLPGKDKIKID